MTVSVSSEQHATAVCDKLLLMLKVCSHSHSAIILASNHLQLFLSQSRLVHLLIWREIKGFNKSDNNT